MRWVFGAAFALVACGGRTELAGSPSEDAAAPVKPVVTCHPGDPPVVLADGLITEAYYDGIATDGVSVYVSQTGASTGTLWRISADDGARTVLRQVSLGGFDHLSPGEDGIYTDLSYFDADAGDQVEEGYWTRADGLAQRTMHWGVFAPPLLYWSDFSTNGTTVNVTSMTEGWTQPILQEPAQSMPPWAPTAVTDRYLYVERHLYDECATLRIDRIDGSVHPLPNLAMTCLTPAVTGPNAVCSQSGCILDEDDTFTLQETSGTRALDATYAYRAMMDGVHRVALRADQDDIVTTLAAYAVAVSNGCVYVKTKTQLVRVAAP